MRSVWLCLAFLLLAMVPASPVTADDDNTPDTQVGDWVFKLPAGMKIVTGLNGKPVLKFRNTPDNYSTTLSFGFSADLQGDDKSKAFQDWAKEGREMLKKTMGVQDDGEVTETRTAAGYDMIAWAAAYKDQRDVTWLTILTCLRRDGRAGGLMFFTNDFDRLETQAAEMDTLLNHATFASCRAKDQKPPKLKVQIDPLSTPSFLWEPTPLPKGDAGLEGIYGASGLGAAGDPREGITTAKFRWRYYTFLADGRVLREIPPEGLLNFRFEFWQQYFVNDCGRYTLKDDVVEMTFTRADGGELKETLKRRGEELLDGDKPYRKLPGEAGLKGTFMRHDVESLGEYYKVGITFNEDGSFDDAGFNARVNIGWWVGGDCVLRDLEATPGKGTWKVAANTLELLYEDGRRRRFGFHRYTDEPGEAPRLIVLNGNVLLRQ
ncbi:MAG: hypothetical protein H6841_10775 [Planctomycetes bacterium]|nr:hypothetical protein [Planctomycetota bacterium]MCB9936276.1 hypothetical protein [Planctomycetota bacterium]